jgi:hypothetical protein
LAEAEVGNEWFQALGGWVSILVIVLLALGGFCLQAFASDDKSLVVLGFILYLPALILASLAVALGILTLVFLFFSYFGSNWVIGVAIVLVLLAVIILARRIFP